MVVDAVGAIPRGSALATAGRSGGRYWQWTDAAAHRSGG